MIKVLKNYIIEVDPTEPVALGDWVYDSLEDIEEGSLILERAMNSVYTEEYGWFKVIKHQPFHGQPELDNVYTYGITVKPVTEITKEHTESEYAEVVNQLILEEYITLKIMELANLLSPLEEGDISNKYDMLVAFLTEQNVVEVPFVGALSFKRNHHRELFNQTLAQ